MYWTNFYNPRNPLSDIGRIQRDLHRLFNEYYPETQRAFPAVNIWTKDDSAVVTAELPGFTKKDVKLSVVDQDVIIEGEPVSEKRNEKEHYHRRERSRSMFKRSIHLPFPIDASKVDARLNNGVLVMSLPRAEEDKPKKIEIQA
ncbi:Hsp20/alpha crystallin family protein [bacterium]|nr:Hsp20/alpha crystallin family protein [bacterium]